MFEHEAVVQRGAPAHRRAVERRSPEPGDQRAQQQLLGKTHARIRRHFERAEFDQPEPAGRAVRRKQFVDADLGAMGVAGDVDQDVAEQPVDQPGRHPVRAAWRRHFADRDFEFVEQVLARFVDARRLAGRPDEQSGEQIGQRRPPQRIEHQALEQIGPPQERAVGGIQAAEHDVIAAAGAGMAAVDHEFVGAEPRQMRVLVNAARDVDSFAPRRRRLDVDLDDAGVGRHFEHIEPRIGRRRVAFDVDRQIELGGGRFDGRDQIEIVVERFDRRHENAQAAVAHLDRQSGAHRHAGSIGGRAGGRLALQHHRFGRERRRSAAPAAAPTRGLIGSDPRIGNGRRSANGSAGNKCG